MQGPERLPADNIANLPPASPPLPTCQSSEDTASAFVCQVQTAGRIPWKTSLPPGLFHVDSAPPVSVWVGFAGPLSSSQSEDGAPLTGVVKV